MENLEWVISSSDNDCSASSNILESGMIPITLSDTGIVTTANDRKNGIVMKIKNWQLQY